MRKQALRATTALGTIVALTAMTACSTGTTPDAGGDLDPKADVTITIGDYPTADKPEEREAFDEQIALFEKANPNITLKPSTETWDAQTFQAKLAGGTLPTVMGVSLTYAHELISNNKVPDMTPYLEELDLVKDLNPLALENVSDDSGKIYAIPTGLFSVGVAYNRDLFTQAGLDPDAPPTTWDEVREYAKTISDKVPGVTGYAQMTKNNTGGWMLTTMTYSMGGSIQDDAGTKSVMGDATKQALQLLHDMRWEDNSMGEQFLYDQDGVRQDFAAGKIGIVLQAPDIYKPVVQTFGMDKDALGVGELPQANGTNGTLTGGTLKLFNVKASPNELLAAAKWIKFYEFQRYFDEADAVERAKSDQAAGNPVGIPGLPPVSTEIDERYLGWIKDYIDVPREHFAGYVESTLPLIAEPPTATQQTYAALDPVVQKILTDENADIDAVLAEATATVDGIIAQAGR